MSRSRVGWPDGATHRSEELGQCTAGLLKGNATSTPVTVDLLETDVFLNSFAHSLTGEKQPSIELY